MSSTIPLSFESRLHFTNVSKLGRRASSEPDLLTCMILNVCFVMNGAKIGFCMSIEMSVMLISRWSNFDMILIGCLISYQIIFVTAQADTL
jgi:hypothetical protein